MRTWECAATYTVDVAAVVVGNRAAAAAAAESTRDDSVNNRVIDSDSVVVSDRKSRGRFTRRGSMDQDDNRDEGSSPLSHGCDSLTDSRNRKSVLAYGPLG